MAHGFRGGARREEESGKGPVVGEQEKEVTPVFLGRRSSVIGGRKGGRSSCSFLKGGETAVGQKEKEVFVHSARYERKVGTRRDWGEEVLYLRKRGKAT